MQVSVIGSNACVLGMKEGVECGAVLQILSRELDRHRGRTGSVQHHFVDSARPRKMHPYPLWQVLKLVALPMARPKRIRSIRSLIHGAGNLLFGLLAAELERAVLDPRPRFTRRRHIPVATRRLGFFRSDSASKMREQKQQTRPSFFGRIARYFLSALFLRSADFLRSYDTCQ